MTTTSKSDGDGLFGRLAVHLRFISLDQLAAATAIQGRASEPKPLGVILREQGMLTQEQIDRVLHQQSEIMAVRRRAEEASAAAADQRRPNPAARAPTLTQVLKGPIDDAAAAPATAPKLPGAPTAIGGVNVQQASAWVQKMIAAAVAEGASDVHFHANERVRMRLHGSLLHMNDRVVPPNVTEAALRDLLSPADQKVLDDDGHVDCALTLAGAGRFRANVYRHAGGVDGVLRIVKPSPPTLAQLGLKNELARLTTFHQGIVLCTGPTGCGKTSTMAALLHMINEERAEHVITIEDPIEVLHPSLRCIVSQRQVGKHTTAFSRALKSALREDPDVIVIGEMRDRETASLALTAAETGHLVLATLHTHSAIRTINRVIGEFPPSQQPTIRAMLSESLRAVVSQRLLPKKNGTGVVAALELLYCTPAVSHLIREGRTHQIKNVMATGQVHGMQTLDDALKDLVQREVVDMAEAARHAEDVRLFNPAATTVGRFDITQLGNEPGAGG